MKRILVFGLSGHLGGTEVVFNTFYNYFDKNKYKFDFVARDGEIAFQDDYKKHGSKIYQTPNFVKRPIKYYITVKGIMSRYDVVYINMLSAANILPVLAAKNSNMRKIILHSHNGNTIGAERKILHFFGKIFLKKDVYVKIACSDAAGKFLFGNSEYKVIKNPFDAEKFKYNLKFRREIRRKFDISDDCVVLGAVGRLSPEKNPLFLVNIVDALSVKYDNIRLMFVGSGKLKKQIIERAKKYNILDKVILVDSTGEVYKYYSALDLFLMPSVYEGLGMSGLEAQAAGLKCIFSDSVPNEIDLGNNLHIKLDLDLWARKISENLDSGRRDRSVDVRKFKRDFGSEINGEKLLRVLDGGVK